jgi:MFS transporter, FSR family, fosmidomycin resistance protein
MVPGSCADGYVTGSRPADRSASSPAASRAGSTGLLTHSTATRSPGSSAAGRASERGRLIVRAAYTLRLGYGLAVPGLLLLAVAPDAAVVFVAAIILGIALFAPFAVQVTLGQDFLPNRIGIASGVTLGLAISVGGLATPLFGLLADSHGLVVTLAVLAVFPAAACALTFRLHDPRPR